MGRNPFISRDLQMKTENGEFLKEQLETLPDTIAKQERELWNKSKEKIGKDLVIKQIDLRTEIEVKDEKKPDGKNAYPNPLSRNIEIAKRIERNTQYQMLKKEMQEIADEVKEKEITISAMKRSFTAATVIPLLGLK